jgi:hypothetical protein
MRQSITLRTIATHRRMIAAVAGCLTVPTAFVVGLVVASTARAASTTYTVKDLGALPGGFWWPA